MSAITTAVGLVAGAAPVTRRVRAYFAPVNRATGQATIFDAAQNGRFLLNAPPMPWVDLGWCSGFARKSATTVVPMRTGAPAVVQSQVRTEIEATVQLEFLSWGKLQLALASGSQQMNLLTGGAGSPANGSGGAGSAAVALLTGASTATALSVGATAAAGFSAGDLIAVDVDYSGQIGFVGSGASAAWVRSVGDVGGNVNFIRRVTLNVGRVTSTVGGMLQLGTALLAGVPTSDMRVSRLSGFVDREGGSFFQEWSGLFCMDGEQGDRVLYHYPRLQAMQSSSEVPEALVGQVERVKLGAAFRALPTRDLNDGETVLCYRSYLPAPMRSV